MKAPQTLGAVSTGKYVSIWLLLVTSAAIALSGAFFTVYAYLHSVTFRVLNVDVAGFVFGLAVLYLGIRYFLSVLDLKKKVFAPDAKFSWSNFKALSKKSRLAKSR